MIKRSLATRLSTVYALLLGLTVLIVILASSIALVVQLFSFTRDIVVAKHEEARILYDQYEREGMTFRQASQEIVDELSGIGLRVTAFDAKGHYVAGDKTLRPKVLDRVISAGGMEHFIPPLAKPPHANGSMPLPPPDPSSFEPFALTMVDGGYVAFAPSIALVLVSLVPYWRIVLTIAIAAMILSWFVGRLFASQLLEPIKEVSTALRSLAGGDYTQRRFMMPGGDEVASLTSAYNEAASSVALAMDERRRGEERMRQFAADASHELRTPLTVIAGYIDVLRRGAVEEPKIARQILSTMSLEKEHMRTLIDRMMRLARLDSETPPNAETIDLAEFLRVQCEAARRLDDRCAIDYSVEGVKEVVADRTELSEAMWNLIENALKYAPDVPIHLRAARTNGHAVITVRDEGPGMSETERMHAFERFYRGDQRGEIAGSGLGLAIAKRAVERAGGQIAIDSAPDRGTTVAISLPSTTS